MGISVFQWFENFNTFEVALRKKKTKGKKANMAAVPYSSLLYICIAYIELSPVFCLARSQQRNIGKANDPLFIHFDFTV